MQPKTSKKFENIKAICDIIDIKYFDDHLGYLRIMWGLKFLSEELKDYACDLSKKHKKTHSQSKFDDVWNGVKYEGITASTLYYYAKKSNFKEFTKVIRKYYLDNTDDNYATTFIRYKCENLVYKEGSAYIFIGNTWYKQDKENNQLQAIITKDLSSIMEDAIFETSQKIKAIVDDEEDDEDTKKANKRERDLLEACREAEVKMLRGIKSATGSKNICKKVIHQLSIMDYDNIEFDDKPDIFPFKNQYYDLNTHQLHYYKANDYILSKVSYDFEKPTTKEMKKIDKLFNQIFTNEDIRKDYTHILSTTLFGRPIDKFIIANGDGGNGKSVLHELLLKALEDTLSYVAPVSVILNKIKQGNNPEVASMNNKRFVVYREPAENEIINAGTLKELTGSDKINARMNYSNDTNTILRATHILEANDKPKISGSTQGNSIDRRLIDIAFNSTFTFDKDMIEENPETHFKADPYLRTAEFKEKYKCSLIQYLINYIKNYDNNGLKVYDEVKMSDYTQDRTKQYIASSDFIMTFCKDTIKKKEDAYIKISDIYDRLKLSDEYINMSKEERRKYNVKFLKTALRKNGLFRKYYKEEHRPYVDGKQKKVRCVLVGWEFNEEDEEEEL